MLGTLRTWRLMAARYGLVLGLLMILRLLFYLVYRAQFLHMPPWQWPQVLLQGLRFDAAAVVLWNAPLIAVQLLGWPWLGGRRAQQVLRLVFMAINGLLLLVCSIDLAFFGFNNKRVGRDLLAQLGPGTRNLHALLAGHGWVAAVFAGLLLVLWWGYARRGDRPAQGGHWRHLLLAVPALGLCVLVARGGWQYQGLAPAHAADHVEAPFAPLVTNSAFTFAHSLARPALAPHVYFTPQELDRRFTLPLALPQRQAGRPNVVLIIVESLGKEYLSAISGEAAYMPFLDSLAAHSLVFTNAYANAERSNKAICSILAGIPSFTEDAFMNTPYADNRVEGLGARLKELGYSTSFFHGGINGEYKFDSFARGAGFDRYYGRDQYPGKGAYDGHWGIYDEEFLQFFASRLDATPEPFCAAVFTLSSHDPFPIPARWKNTFPKGDQEIHESLGYTDMALQRFFSKARRAPWYSNTLFVITGDHTFQYNVHPPWYMNPAGRFAVPIIFHRPGGHMAGTDTTLAQQLDIMPSILDLAGHGGTVNSFGRSLFSPGRVPYAVQYLNGQYQLMQGDRMLFFNGEKATGLYAFRSDTLFAHDLLQAEPAQAERMRLFLQAMVQRYGQAMVNNELAAPGGLGQ